MALQYEYSKRCWKRDSERFIGLKRTKHPGTERTANEEILSEEWRFNNLKNCWKWEENHICEQTNKWFTKFNFKFHTSKNAIATELRKRVRGITRIVEYTNIINVILTNLQIKHHHYHDHHHFTYSEIARRNSTSRNRNLRLQIKRIGAKRWVAEQSLLTKS